MKTRTLFCFCPLLLVISCTGKKDDVTSNEVGQVDEIGGHLDIRIHAVEGKLAPPADLVLVDPRDRKTGKDPRVDRIFTDIPSSSYETESIDDDVTGAAGPETRELNPSTARFLDIDIRADSDHRYVIEYSSEPGSKIEARRD